LNHVTVTRNKPVCSIGHNSAAMRQKLKQNTENSNAVSLLYTWRDFHFSAKLDWL